MRRGSAAAQKGVAPPDVRGLRLAEPSAWVPLVAVRDRAGLLTGLSSPRADDIVRVRGSDAINHLDRLQSGWWARFVSFECRQDLERVVHNRRGETEMMFVRFAHRECLTCS
jgi:hypothetical protein